VLPVGPPDAEARGAIWSRYAEEITDLDVEIDALVAESALFTPADIEFAARKPAQHAYEREHFEGASHRATQDDFPRRDPGHPPVLVRGDPSRV
jgi:SpoVK/Ycf46/Vps4 family AAA+-type ATPase